jgi:D-alanyl-D-alanine carboxypeptidase
MDDTTLPDPGNVECLACAHGYIAMEGGMLDCTNVDPSMAGASGGHALISTAADLARLLEQLQAGAFFERAETLDTMLAFQPAPDPQKHLIGYGLGIMQIEAGGDVVIGHLGGTAGYTSFMLYVPATDRYMSGFMNVMGDPSAVLLPVVARLAQP